MKRLSFWHFFLKILFSVVIAFTVGILNAQTPTITNGTSISVFRNTCSSGSITTGSFAVKVDYMINDPMSVVIGDIDGDGKPDLAVTSGTSPKVSVFHNTSTSGIIEAGSFDTNADFTTGGSPIGFGIGDIDCDGKPDLVVANYGSNTVSVLRNTISENVTVPPVIGSFTPASGPIGTTVTIIGTHFDTTPANNIVWFGAVKATVTSASATELTVTVPAGASYQPITVTVDGLTAYSGTPFNVTFTGSGVIDVTSFAAKVDFYSGMAPRSTGISDLDGDGKPDLVITNAASNTISVYKNISSTGSVSDGSFDSKVDFSTGSLPNNMAIGDIDGDGKPDLAVSYSDNNYISVFRNTSTPGSFTSGSFAARVDFTTGNGPEGIIIGDIDGDGKPDLAIASFHSSSVSVFRNTCITGSISASSFESFVGFNTGMGSNPKDVAIGDIDGDGKPDLAVTNGSGNNVSVFRNISSPGSITTGSLEPKVDFVTGDGPHDVTFADLDGDGKLDLTIANFLSSSVSVFRNTSSSGAFTTGSFAVKVDYTNIESPESVAIGDINGDGKPDLVFRENATVSVLRNTSNPGSIGAGSFSPRIDFPIGGWQGEIVIGDLDCDGKPELVCANGDNNTISVLRNRISEPVPPGDGTILGSIEFESSVLTLNGDGINERLIIKNFESYGRCNIYIYNSRGVLIYSQKDYLNDWNLMISNHVLEAGGYFYVLETESGVFRGSFSILS